MSVEGFHSMLLREVLLIKAGEAAYNFSGFIIPCGLPYKQWLRQYEAPENKAAADALLGAIQQDEWVPSIQKFLDDDGPVEQLLRVICGVMAPVDSLQVLDLETKDAVGPPKLFPLFQRMFSVTNPVHLAHTVVWRFSALSTPLCVLLLSDNYVQKALARPLPLCGGEEKRLHATCRTGEIPILRLFEAATAHPESLWGFLVSDTLPFRALFLEQEQLSMGAASQWSSTGVQSGVYIKNEKARCDCECRCRDSPRVWRMRVSKHDWLDHYYSLGTNSLLATSMFRMPYADHIGEWAVQHMPPGFLHRRFGRCTPWSYVQFDSKKAPRTFRALLSRAPDFNLRRELRESTSLTPERYFRAYGVNFGLEGWSPERYLKAYGENFSADQIEDMRKNLNEFPVDYHEKTMKICVAVLHDHETKRSIEPIPRELLSLVFQYSGLQSVPLIPARRKGTVEKKDEERSAKRRRAGARSFLSASE